MESFTYSYREKFKPFTGDLLSGNFLLCASKRVMNCTWKEADSHEECNETGTAAVGSETENKGGGLRQGLDGDRAPSAFPFRTDQLLQREDPEES